MVFLMERYLILFLAGEKRCRCVLLGILIRWWESRLLTDGHNELLMYPDLKDDQVNFKNLHLDRVRITGPLGGQTPGIDADAAQTVVPPVAVRALEGLGPGLVDPEDLERPARRLDHLIDVGQLLLAVQGDGLGRGLG